MKPRYIDANLAKEALLGWDTDPTDEEIEYTIDEIPTADVVEVKHGEWDINVGMNYNKERICPVCKERIEGNHWNFCSNCGAKMDGGSGK